jgi:hypothetical protein
LSFNDALISGKRKIWKLGVKKTQDDEEEEEEEED